MDGRIREFRLPTPGSRPNGVATAPDGVIWFTEFHAEKVGRLTTTGEVTDFALPAKGPPIGIVAGADSKIWVTVPAAHAICRVSPDGTEEALVMPGGIIPGLIAMGADGNLWFAEPNGMIGRFSPSGVVDQFSAVSHVRNPHAEAEQLLISGP